MRRTLVLRKETLAELAPGDLAQVRGGTVHVSFDNCVTWMCTPIATAVLTAIERGLSVQDCP